MMSLTFGLFTQVSKFRALWVCGVGWVVSGGGGGRGRGGSVLQGKTLKGKN